MGIALFLCTPCRIELGMKVISDAKTEMMGPCENCKRKVSATQSR